MNQCAKENWLNGIAKTKRVQRLTSVMYILSGLVRQLQNYKCLASTTISGDGIYAEYTYNGDKQELYEDVYGKLTNTCHTEE